LDLNIFSCAVHLQSSFQKRLQSQCCFPSDQPRNEEKDRFDLHQLMAASEKMLTSKNQHQVLNKRSREGFEGLIREIKQKYG
jgi:hypothetical protein